MSFAFNRPALRLLIAAALAALAAGCGEEPVQVYDAPKETAVPDIMAAPGPGMPAGDGDAGEVTLEWKIPAGWEQRPNAGPMRYATFRVGEGENAGELTVVALGPEASDVTANVNRWRGQLGLPAGADKGTAITPFAGNGFTATLVDIQSGMLAAIIPIRGRVWFFKLTGDETLVAAQKKNFGSFINSLRFVSAPNSSAPESTNADEKIVMPPGHPALPPMGASPVDPTRRAAGPPGVIAAWTVPPGWTQDALSPGSMRVASFHVGDGQGKAEVTLVALPGSAGGALENLNRWRGQVGLGPIVEMKDQPATPLEIADAAAIMIDMDGPAGQPPDKQRSVVVVLVRGEKSWFFKLMGARSTVGAEKNNFESFVRSIRFAADNGSAQGAGGG